MSALARVQRRSCEPLAPGTPPLAYDAVRARLQAFPGWTLESGAIVKAFAFRDFSATMAFVNAVAWMAAREDHHPQMQVTHDSCRIAYHTHSVGGISENDFICAAKVEALWAG